MLCAGWGYFNGCGHYSNSGTPVAVPPVNVSRVGVGLEQEEYWVEEGRGREVEVEVCVVMGTGVENVTVSVSLLVYQDPGEG